MVLHIMRRLKKFQAIGMIKFGTSLLFFLWKILADLTCVFCGLSPWVSSGVKISNSLQDKEQGKGLDIAIKSHLRIVRKT